MDTNNADHIIIATQKDESYNLIIKQFVSLYCFAIGGGRKNQEEQEPILAYNCKQGPISSLPRSSELVRSRNSKECLRIGHQHGTDLLRNDSAETADHPLFQTKKKKRNRSNRNRKGNAVGKDKEEGHCMTQRANTTPAYSLSKDAEGYDILEGTARDEQEDNKRLSKCAKVSATFYSGDDVIAGTSSRLNWKRSIHERKPSTRSSSITLHNDQKAIILEVGIEGEEFASPLESSCHTRNQCCSHPKGKQVSSELTAKSFFTSFWCLLIAFSRFLRAKPVWILPVFGYGVNGLPLDDLTYSPDKAEYSSAVSELESLFTTIPAISLLRVTTRHSLDNGRRMGKSSVPTLLFLVLLGALGSFVVVDVDGGFQRWLIAMFVIGLPIIRGGCSSCHGDGCSSCGGGASSGGN